MEICQKCSEPLVTHGSCCKYQIQHHKDRVNVFDTPVTVDYHNGLFGYWPDIKWKYLSFALHDHIKINENGACDDIEIIGNIYGISTKNDNPNPNEDT